MSCVRNCSLELMAGWNDFWRVWCVEESFIECGEFIGSVRLILHSPHRSRMNRAIHSIKGSRTSLASLTKVSRRLIIRRAGAGFPWRDERANWREPVWLHTRKWRVVRGFCPRHKYGVAFSLSTKPRKIRKSASEKRMWNIRKTYSSL